MTSKTPCTIYLQWPERDLHAPPWCGFFWGSPIETLMATYGNTKDKPCKPVLLLVDEGGRTAIPSLADHATTIVGRGIYLWMAIQSLSQLDTVYGQSRARILRNNMEAQIFYRPSDLKTAEYLERRLGKRSSFAHSHTKHRGSESEGLSEQGIPLMTAQAILQMHDEDIIGFHRSLPPFKAKRMDWRHFLDLEQKLRIEPPSLSPLPKNDHQLPALTSSNGETSPALYFDPDTLVETT